MSFFGSQVRVGSRAKDCRRCISSAPHPLQVTLAIIKPTVCAHPPGVQQVTKIVRTKPILWTETDASKFYAEHLGKFYYDRLILGMTAGPALGICLRGPDAIQQWRKLIGPTKAYRSAWEAPDCLRAELGIGDTRNGFHGSDSMESAMKELSLVFPEWDATSYLEGAMKRYTE